jgi:hypothetical protein
MTQKGQPLLPVSGQPMGQILESVEKVLEAINVEEWLQDTSDCEPPVLY